MTQVVDINDQPRRRRRATDVQQPEASPVVKPPPLLLENPSTMDVFKAIERVHDCLNTHVEESRSNFDKVHTRITDMKDVVHGVDVRVARMEGAQTATTQALGVRVPDECGAPQSSLLSFQTLATMRPLKAGIAGLLTLGAFMVGYRVIAAIAPPAWEFLKAVNHVLMTAATS